MSSQQTWNTLTGAAPLVIAHRGASGYRPEHTLAAYALAIELGADYIEPDLVATRDGELIARHEPLLDDTTDVRSHAQFARRKTTRLIDDRAVTGFFACDFTLAEIRQLRAIQPRAARSTEYDGQFAIPTFEEVLALVTAESARRQRPIGVYPETKHPSFHLQLGLPLEERLLHSLLAYELHHADSRVFIQSFESANLQYLRARTTVPLVQLLDQDAIEFDASGSRVRGLRIPQWGDPRGDAHPQTLADVRAYAQAVGPAKRLIARDLGEATLRETDLIERAHDADLAVHAYTLRNELHTLAPQYGHEPIAEYRHLFRLGVDGVFTDFPDTALQARGVALP